MRLVTFDKACVHLAGHRTPVVETGAEQDRRARQLDHPVIDSGFLEVDDSNDAGLVHQDVGGPIVAVDQLRRQIARDSLGNQATQAV